jgi:hypothetical protein
LVGNRRELVRTAISMDGNHKHYKHTILDIAVYKDYTKKLTRRDSELSAFGLHVTIFSAWRHLSHTTRGE